MNVVDVLHVAILLLIVIVIFVMFVIKQRVIVPVTKDVIVVISINGNVRALRQLLLLYAQNVVNHIKEIVLLILPLPLLLLSYVLIVV